MQNCKPQERPYPEEYWITAELVEQLKSTRSAGRRVGINWKGNSVENWYTLFEMLLPDIVRRIGSKAIRSQYLPCESPKHRIFGGRTTHENVVALLQSFY